MTLPARQQHALDQIEHQFENEPQLMALFAAFTRIAAAEAMPAREVITRRLPRIVLICVMTLTVVGAVLLGTLVGSPRCANSTTSTRSLHAAPVVGCRPPATTTAGSSGR